MSNGLYPDQNRRSVGTELGPNYLQMLSADKERVWNFRNNEYKIFYIFIKKKIGTKTYCVNIIKRHPCKPSEYLRLPLIDFNAC